MVDMFYLQEFWKFMSTCAQGLSEYACLHRECSGLCTHNKGECVLVISSVLFLLCSALIHTYMAASVSKVTVYWTRTF